MMHKLRVLFIFLSIALHTTSCSDEDDTICYSFSQRQCQTDPWFELDESLGSTERIEQYLKDENIDVKSVSAQVIELVTCQACHVCPDGAPLIIIIDQSDASKIEALDLLGLEKIDNCT